MISLFEFGLCCCISMFGIVCARLWWPCAEPFAWTLLISIFIVCICFTLFLHMYTWKCWTYIWKHRRRLQSLPGPQRRAPFITMSVVVIFQWSLFYWFVTMVSFCNLPWWPSVVVFITYTGIAVSVGSYSRSSSEPSSPDSLSSIVKLESSAGRSSSSISNGMSSSEDSE